MGLVGDCQRRSNKKNMTPTEYCESKAAASGSSFYYSFMFLDPLRRSEILALYAFCREVDDVADSGAIDIDVARAKLLWWKSELDNTWLGKPNHPVTRALQGAITRHNLKKIHFDLIIEGMLMDLANTHYATFAELDEYCYRVAGVVGILTATIFGHKNAMTLEFAKRLGLAFQLTNILRDVKEDIERKRVYIPAEDLMRFGLKPAEGIDSLNRPAFIEMMQFQISRTENIYKKAIEILPDEDRENQKAGIIMANIYQSLLHKIKKNPAKVLDRRVSLAPLTKLWIAYRTWASQ